MIRPLVKICGITRADDAIAAAEEGADFLGLIFVQDSPRFVSPAAALRIAMAVKDEIGTRAPGLVGVFMNDEPARVRAVTAEVGLDLIQLHGDENPDPFAGFERPLIKVFRVGAELPDTAAWSSARWLLFDTFMPGTGGGTGRAFDWSLLSRVPKENLILSGGLHPDNIVTAIETVRPAAVDLSSGVEDAPGIKSRKKIAELFERIGGV
ncbi:MAG TPA: phosphoribosylanthranilate isomerase [Thermoanaerobaculia bacterium]|nr:phosphoribosylanthranilate isomerase [Thermoanaerobaculia bacterium]